MCLDIFCKINSLISNLTHWFHLCQLGNNEEYCSRVLDAVFPFSSYKDVHSVVLLFLGCFICAACVLAMAIYAREMYREYDTPRTLVHQESLTDRDQKYALENLGEDSVYRFFLGTSRWGWFIVAATIIVQLSIMTIFVGGSKRDLSYDKSDMVYTWKCTRDQATCFSIHDLDWQGWSAFAIFMAAHLLKDGINGLKMIKHSTKRRVGRNVRIRLFIGGTLLTLVTAYTTYVSIMYNMAIAISESPLNNV